ncbi:MAG: class I SAM-dependent methyltransferase, partial [Bdellovibrionales bacterium]|nr:class I SAM-dependent methyltransferase [Bdellovibrionales bacterium]
RIVDLCCGPGQFTGLLAKSFTESEIHALDLSRPMLRCLERNVPRAIAHCEDMIEAPSLPRGEFDLVTAMNCLHHLSTEEQVSRAIETMESLSTPDGVIFVSFLLRLKSQQLTALYTETFGMKGFSGFERFHRDFELSMQAAWTEEEMVRMIPSSPTKTWFLITPMGVSTVFFLIGIPSDRDHLFLDEVQIPGEIEGIVPQEFQVERRLLKLAFGLGRCRQIGRSNC